ncbi:RHS repeat-associated core domain protein [Granulicella mallensis MP5ACTX8]|uniref:RHS repeat-associated core domain protein n=2 Tax=Granulicella mallensis TaxID=940614 RepID=G8NQF4_GRAMM|nr:RHS repeat-associated core domain protein [Granulicella mallensis MP5ACTX8]
MQSVCTEQSRPSFRMRARKSAFTYKAVLIVVWALCGSFSGAKSNFLQAQLTAVEEKGLPSDSTFQGGDIDLVNLHNGNLHISIPLASLKQRGGTTLSWSFVYDTQGWIKQWYENPGCGISVPGAQVVTAGVIAQPLGVAPPGGGGGNPVNCNPPGQYLVAATKTSSTGWRLSNPFNWSVEYLRPTTSAPCLTDANLMYIAVTNWRIVDPQGTSHALPLREELDGNGTCLGQTLKGPALDGSGIVYDAQANTVYLKDGTQIMPGAQGEIRDRNGNIMSLQGDTDTLNRSPVTTTSGPGVTYTTPLGNAIQGYQYTNYTVYDSSGNPQVYKVDYQAMDFASNMCTEATMSGTQSQSYPCEDTVIPIIEPWHLTLPSGKAYVFTFNNGSMGELAKVDLPTGGSISYSYSGLYQTQPNTIPGQQPNWVGGPGVTSRTVTVNGAANKWTYKINPDEQATVTDPLGNTQIHTYGLVQPSNAPANYNTYLGAYYDTSATYSDSSGNLLKTVANDYTAEYDPINNAIANVRVIRTTTTLAGNQVTKKETDYETFQYNCLDAISCPGTATRLNPTETREYDYGTGTPGGLLRRTDYTYLHTGNQSYINLNIVSDPAVVSIYDGSGTMAAQTTYEYDNYSHLNQPMVASAAVQHDTGYGTSFTTRGNVTAIEKWRNTDGALLTSTNQFDDAGNLLSTIDPLKHQTSFDYTDSWSNSICAPSGAGKEYLTKTTNAAGQVTTSKYDSCTGEIASTTDSNLQTTSWTYDVLNRPKQISYPDGGQTSYCYSDIGTGSCPSSSVLSITGTTKLTSALNFTSTSIFDGLGRTIQTQLTSDPSGVTYSDTTYDGVGHVASVSNPYRGGQSGVVAKSQPTTTYTYDGLGQKIVQTNQDGTTEQWCYDGISSVQSNCSSNKSSIKTGSWVDVTDPNGHHTQQVSDVLGRLTAVMEPDPASGALSLETDYQYDTLSNLTRVDQWGGPVNSSGVRTRSFNYDSLSLLHCASNPENSQNSCPAKATATLPSGVTSYVYDASSNLKNKTDARGITTTYSYDALNRLISKTYSDGTAGASFGYDETGDFGAAGCGGTGFVQCNTIGRLSSATVANVTQSIYSYDAMGRMTVKSTCVASLCGSDRIDQFFTYDLAGNLTSYDHGTDVARNAYYGGHGLSYDSAGRLNLVTGYQQPASPSNLFKATSYGPVGLLESSLGNGLNETRSYDNRMRQTSYNALNAAPTSSPSTLTGYMDDFQNNDVERFPGVTINGSALPQNGLLQVGGWAATAQSCPVAAVEIDIDQTAIGYASLDKVRSDVQSLVYNNDGHHADCGYNFVGSIGGASVGPHSVNVYALDASGNRQLLVDGPGNNTITVSADPPPTGTIDGTVSLPGQITSGGLMTLSGWAIDSQMHAPVGAVKILIDGIPIGYATLGAPRPDVAAAYGDQRYANSGWVFTGSIGNLSVGQHTATAIIYDSGGQSTPVTQATVYNSQTQTWGLAPVIISVVADKTFVSSWFDLVQNASDQTSVVPLNGSIFAGGWVGETQNQTACAKNISRVDVLVDGYYVGQAQLGGARPDVVAAFQNPSCLNSGWSFTGTVSNIDPGVHIFTARAYDETGGSIMLANSGTMQINAQLSPASVTNPLPSQYAWSLGYEPNSNVGYAFDSVNGNYAYLYDNLNRLVAAGSSTTGLQWSYDSFGNRTSQVVTAGSGTSSYETFNANNQPNDVAFDAAGNALGTGVVPLQYDAENRLINANGIRYIYDAEGQRVAKYSGNTLTNVYLYDQAGHVVTELDGSFNVIRREVYAGSRHLGTYDQSGNLTYVLSDWLGTERARANNTGTLCETTTSQPFGDNQQTSGTCFPSPTFFTGKERDAESGLDYFGARYFGSSMGRWMSPDWASDPQSVPYATYTNPQSLNLYSYVENNPITQRDADGHAANENIGSAEPPKAEDGIVILIDDSGPETPLQVSRTAAQDAAERAYDVQGTEAFDVFAAPAGAQQQTCKCEQTIQANQEVVDSVSDYLKKSAEITNTAIMTAGAAVIGAVAATAGPKADTAPGITAGGQATDQYGNKIGPSGKAQIDQVDHTGKKSARDAARRGGKGKPVQHPSPTKGKPHFHPTDSEGEKLPTSVHHNYPN